MRSPHLLRVEEEPGRFAPLIAAARAEGLRIGWLDLAAAPAVPGPLDEAAAAGAHRAVAAGEGRSVAVKPLRGAPVVKDLLREHFPDVYAQADVILCPPPGLPDEDQHQRYEDITTCIKVSGQPKAQTCPDSPA